jgi:glycine oxidase
VSSVNHPDVIVVGGGIIGLLTAWYLRQQSVQVMVIERGGIGRESSWAGGGILSPLYPWRYDDTVTRLAQWSQNHYWGLCQQVQDETGIDPQWQRSGFLSLNVDDVGDAFSWAKRWGYRVESVSGEKLSGLEPELGIDTDGIWMPDVAQVRNPRLAQALRAWLVQDGVVLREQDAVRQLLTEHSRIVGVMTESGRFHADQVVIAGGAWTARILAELGCPAEISPVKGQMILIRAIPGLVTRMVICDERYVIPRRDGRVLFGSTLEYEGFDKTTDDAVQRLLMERACALIPKLGNYPIERHWAGLRPGTPDGVPFIGKHPDITGLYINAGHFRNGVVTGPASAEKLVRLMLG